MKEKINNIYKFSQPFHYLLDFLLLYNLIFQTFCSNIIKIKLIKTGPAGKIIKDEYYKISKFTAVVDSETYVDENFTNSITPKEQTVTLEWKEELTKCCEGMFDVGEPYIIEEIDMSNFSLQANKITSTKDMFLYQKNLKKILNIANLQTNNVEDMSSMFQNCESLEEIDLSNNAFTKVKTMEKMFYQAIKLKILKFPNVNVSDLNINEMVENCYSLESIDFSNVKINQNIQLENLFKNDTSLIDIKMPNINVEDPINFDNYFDSLINLVTIQFYSDNNIKVNSSKYMFNNCFKLTNLDIRKLLFNDIIDMSYMFNNCTSLISISLSNIEEKDIGVDLAYMFNNCTNLERVDFSEQNKLTILNMTYLFNGCKRLENIFFPNIININNVVDFSFMFNDCEKLEELDLIKFGKTQVFNSMKGMFNNCNNLKSLYLSNFDFSNTYNIENIFDGCSSLQYLNLSNFKKGIINSFSYLFKDCINLQTIDLSNFEGSLIENRMDYMFHGCQNLISIELLNLDLSNTKNMSYMFNRCLSLKTVKLKNLEGTAVVDYSFMFNDCISLEFVDLYEFRNSNKDNYIYDMKNMFNNCKKVKYIDFSNLDVSYAFNHQSIFTQCINLESLKLTNYKANNKDLSYMFNNLINLVSIDLTNFEGSSVNTTMEYMFNNCENLVELDLSKLKSSSIINMDHMFNGCSSLYYLNLSSFNYSYSKSFSYMFSDCIELKLLDISNFKGSLVENSMDFMFNNCQSLTSISLANVNFFYTTNISHIFNGCISLTNVILINLNELSIFDYSFMFSNCISLKYIDLSNFKTSTKVDNKKGYMFNDCHNLISIDFSYLDISFTVDYYNIFKSCNNLQYLNLSHLQADYITNLSYLFSNMSYLISIDLSNFNSPLYEHSLAGMFFNCKKLESINLCSYDFSRTYNITDMFRGCFSLISLDISSFKYSIIYDFSYLFNDCEKLSYLSMSNFKGSLRENRMDYMFSNCKSLTNIQLINLDLANTINISGIFNSCISLIELNLTNKANSAIEDFSYMFNNCYSLTYINFVDFHGSLEENIMDYMFNNCTKLEKITFYIGLSGFDTRYTKSMKFMFNNCSSIISSDMLTIIINGVSDISYMFNNCTSLTTFNLNEKMYVTIFLNYDLVNFEYMFNNCTHLEKIDISYINIDKDIILKGMFSNCISLKSINFFEFLITKGKDFSYMFQNCLSLESLDLSVFNQIIVENTIEGIFFNCNNLSYLNIKEFDTHNTTNMKMMFFNCSKLSYLDLSNFTTSSVICMNAMFSNCKSLTSLNLDSFKTETVLDMSSMFQNCESINILSLNNLNTSLVKRMDNMFSNCYNLISLYISDFDTKSVISMASMFENCSSLILLNIGGFDTSSVTEMSSMFSNCFSMEYLNISNFSERNLVKYDNIFGDIKENVAFCYNGEKNKDSVISKILGQKLCSTNNCENNWSSRQRLFNFGEKKCVDNCLENDILKYQFISTCYDRCPNNSVRFKYQENLCEIICPEETPYYSRTHISCIDECIPFYFFNKECKINNYNKALKEKMAFLTDNDILNDARLFYLIIEKIFETNETLIMQTEDQIYQITSFKKGIQLNTKINFLEIESEFKKIYNLDNNSQLVIFLTETQKEGIKIPIIEYNIYDLNSKQKLNLSNASHLEFEVQIPINLNENEEYLYNLDSDYYTNPCVRAVSKNGYNMIINDRLDEFIKNNYSLCEKNCKYIIYNSNSKINICKCRIKSNFKYLTEILLDNDLLFSNIKRKKRITNFYVLRCLKLISEKNEILKNFGSIFVLIIFFFFIVTILLFVIYGYDALEKEIKQLLFAKFYSLENKDRRKSQNLPSQFEKFKGLSITFSKDSIIKNNLKDTGLFFLSPKDNSEIYNILELTDLEKNLLLYQIAIEEDKRKFFEYYFSLIKRNNYILFSFFPNIDYNSRIIKIYLFFFNLAIFLLINTFFFTDTIIHQINISNGNLHFKEKFSTIICSFIISYIIIIGNKYLALTELDIIQIKHVEKKEKLGILYAKLLKKIFRKYIILTIIYLLFFIFSWIYLTCFFAIYRNTQITVLINTIISFAVALLFPLVFCFIPTFLRYFSLSDYARKRKNLYNISRIVQII